MPDVPEPTIIDPRSREAVAAEAEVEAEVEKTSKSKSGSKEKKIVGRIFRSIDEIRETAPPLEPLWGFFLFKKAITAFISDPGVGKTSFGYVQTQALCQGKSFLSIHAEEPVNALYMDYESGDSLVASRAAFVLGDEKIPNFYIYNNVDFTLHQIKDELIAFCKEKNINLITIDNQSLAFSTRDENDNAEAIKQMRFIRQIANECNCAIILVHHTSKANLPGTRKATGAFARARLADVIINIEVAGEDIEASADTSNLTEEEKLESSAKILMLECAKNRMVDERVLWFIKRDEGKFYITDPPLGTPGKPTSTRLYAAQRELLLIMRNGGSTLDETYDRHWKFAELAKKMNEKGFSNSWADHAVRKLGQQNRIYKPTFGYYSLRRRQQQ